MLSISGDKVETTDKSQLVATDYCYKNTTQWAEDVWTFFELGDSTWGRVELTTYTYVRATAVGHKGKSDGPWGACADFSARCGLDPLDHTHTNTHTHTRNPHNMASQMDYFG